MTEPRIDPAALVREVRPRWDAAHVERALDVQLRAQRRHRVRRVVTGVGLAAAAAALVAIGVGAWPERAHEVAETRGDRAAPSVPEHIEPSLATTSDVLTLPDGSTLTPDTGSEVSLIERGPSRVRAALRSGSVELDVVPDPDRELRVEAGAVTVIVLGTAFRVARDGDEVVVVVHRGRVAVEHPAPGGIARTELSAGESGRFPQSPPPAATSVSIDGDEPAARSRAAEPAVPTALVSARDWRRLAEDGEYDAAYDALTDEGTPRIDSLEELLLAADAARLSGHPREALVFLERAEASAAGDPRAPLAAFSSGRLLGQLGRHREAAEAFERALRLEPSGSLAEDAMVRAAEARARADQPELARALARRYLDAHPDGRGAARMRALLP